MNKLSRRERRIINAQLAGDWRMMALAGLRHRKSEHCRESAQHQTDKFWRQVYNAHECLAKADKEK
jgi:hypothetical protein